MRPDALVTILADVMPGGTATENAFADARLRYIGQQIKAARKTHDPKLTQEQLAAAVGISRHHVMRLEAGKGGKPSYPLMSAIARATGQSLAFFDAPYEETA